MTLQLSKTSVTSYLPYEKGVYFPAEEKDKISVGAERQRRYRAVKLLRKERTEENLWNNVVIYAGVKFWTFSRLPFTYELRRGKSEVREDKSRATQGTGRYPGRDIHL